MSADETLGRSVVRNVVTEELHHIVNGFIGATGQTFYPNMMVSITSAGEVTPITSTATQPLGYVVSKYDTNDSGRVRVAVPFQKTEYCYADGAIDEGNLLAYSGFDTTSEKPKYKVAVAGDWVVAICTTAATDTTTTGKVGLLRTPFRLVDANVYSFAQAAAVADEATVDGSDPATTQALANALKVKVNALLASLRTANLLDT